MIVKTKTEASREAVRSLFKEGGTINLREKRVFCTGKYKESIIGSPVVDLPGVLMVWGERRSGSEGAYIKLYCI